MPKLTIKDAKIFKIHNSTIEYELTSWCNDIEESAQQQIDNLCAHPIIEKIAIMPDCHAGYGMPIGGVIATHGGIIPNAVGVDIGCGMRACKTTLHRNDISIGDIKSIMGLLRKAIPVGMNHNDTPCDDNDMPTTNDGIEISPILQKEWNACYQIGTLGGGNHFIEIQYDENGDIWYMIHSGSRNLGYKAAHYHNKIANELNLQWKHDNLVHQELAFLPINTIEYFNYWHDMKYCLSFALKNREIMSQRIKDSFLEIIPIAKFGDDIDIHHNYAEIENHYGKNYFVHRKGATRARKGEIGIIPGSQGTSSYIVEGLGDIRSLTSCSHGAGRAMSRRKARETLSLEEEQKKLDDKGIIHAIRNKEDLDEAASAYKDIDVVMENQKELVKILHTLKPLAVIKG